MQFEEDKDPEETDTDFNALVLKDDDADALFDDADIPLVPDDLAEDEDEDEDALDDIADSV